MFEQGANQRPVYFHFDVVRFTISMLLGHALICHVLSRFVVFFIFSNSEKSNIK